MWYLQTKNNQLFGSEFVQGYLLSFLLVNLFVLFVFVDHIYYFAIFVELDENRAVTVFVENQLEFVVVEGVFWNAVLVGWGVVERRGDDGVQANSEGIFYQTRDYSIEHWTVHL